MATENEQVSNNTSKSISNYENYATNVPTGGSTANFISSSKIPVAGSYDGGTTKETRSISVADLGKNVPLAAGGGLERNSGDEITLSGISTATTGYVASKSSNGGIEWISPSTGDITGITAGTGLTGGGESGAVTVGIDIENATDGQVLTYFKTEENDEEVEGVKWTTSSGIPALPTDADTKNYVLGVKGSKLMWLLEKSTGSGATTLSMDWVAPGGHAPEPKTEQSTGQSA